VPLEIAWRAECGTRVVRWRPCSNQSITVML